MFFYIKDVTMNDYWATLKALRQHAVNISKKDLAEGNRLKALCIKWDSAVVGEQVDFMQLGKEKANVKG